MGLYLTVDGSSLFQLLWWNSNLGKPIRDVQSSTKLEGLGTVVMWSEVRHDARSGSSFINITPAMLEETWHKGILLMHRTKKRIRIANNELWGKNQYCDTRVEWWRLQVWYIQDCDIGMRHNRGYPNCQCIFYITQIIPWNNRTLT